MISPLKESLYKEIQNYPGVIFCCWHDVSLVFLMFCLKPMEESNLFAKFDILWVTRLLRASNLASSLSIFENSRMSLLLCLSLGVHWGVEV